MIYMMDLLAIRRKPSSYLLEQYKSDGGSRQHHNTTKSTTIPYVPKWQVP